ESCSGAVLRRKIPGNHRIVAPSRQGAVVRRKTYKRKNRNQITNRSRARWFGTDARSHDAFRRNLRIRSGLFLGPEKICAKGGFSLRGGKGGKRKSPMSNVLRRSRQVARRRKYRSAARAHSASTFEMQLYRGVCTRCGGPLLWFGPRCLSKRNAKYSPGKFPSCNTIQS